MEPFLFMRRFWPGLILVAGIVSVSAGEGPDRTTIHDALKVPEGLEIQVWAESPLFHNPTSMDVDARGRVWVAEAVNYRGFRNKEQNPKWHEKGDRIMILEDSDGDGKADSSKVFVQDEELVAPMGVAVFGDKVVVSCAPNLLVYTKDAADRVVKKEKLLTGFGGFDHDHSLHKVVAGPDGRWYFNTGNAGPHIVTDRSGWTLRSGSSYSGGTPYNTTNEPGLVSDDGRVYVSGIQMRINPDGTGLEVLGMGFRNPVGSCVDSFGDIWMNDNDDTFSCRTTWLMRYGDCGFASKDGARTWQADRRPGQDTQTAHWRQEDPGVIPSGHVYGNGSPTGIAYYENGSLGAEWEGGLLLSCEAGQNVVWGYRRVRDGAGFKLEGFPFVTSTGVQDEGYVWSEKPDDVRMWFRPSDVAVGTDGAVYLSDWFDPFVGGHRLVDLKAEGTIYRIVRKGTNPRPPAAERETIEGAVALLCSPAENVRNAGLQQLVAAGPAAIGVLQDLMRGEDRFLRARAVWALARCGGEGVEVVRGILKNDADPEIRIAAFRALESVGDTGLLKEARRLSKDESPAVRRAVTNAMRDVPLAESQEILIAIAKRYDGADRWYLEALGTGCDGKEIEMYGALLGIMGAPAADWSSAFADIAWRLHPRTAVPALLDRAMTPGLSPEARRQAIDALAFIEDKAAAEAMLEIAKNGPRDQADYAAYWVTHRDANDWNAFAMLEKLDPSMRKESTNRLAGRLSKQLQSKKTAPKEKLQLATKLAKTAEGALNLTNLIRRGALSKEVLEAVIPLLEKNADAAVKAQLDRALARAPGAAASNTALVKEIAQLKGDPARGRELFFGAAVCATCHQFNGEGREIGPDMSKIREKFDRTGLVDSIVNPSSAVLVGYEATLIETKGGAVYLGFVEADGPIVVLKDLAGQRQRIEKAEIIKREVQENSMMPPVAGVLKPAQIADVVAFLREG